MLPEPEPIILPPERESDRDEWRKEIAAWRDERKAALHYDGAAYDKPEFQWVSSCYSCAMLMTWDETFLDRRTGDYRVEQYLHEGEQEFGGYDATVLWHAYPRIGFDQRNQFDFYRGLPGGVAGLKRTVKRFHNHNVRVFVDYNPWDAGSRREGQPDAQSIGDLIKATGVDGVFLDTLNKGDVAMREAADRAKPGVGFESEDALPVDDLPQNHLSWAQWFDYGVAPGVLRNRWFEPRHMMHVIRRWDVDHTNEIHLAWMNGAGTLVWENVFGSWIGWSAENRRLLRAMLPIQRFFSRHFSHGQWTPLVATIDPGMYASEWSLRGSRLWTIVNRGTKSVVGPWIAPKLSSSETLFDLMSGRPVDLHSMVLEPAGIAALLAVETPAITPGLRKFLANRAKPTRGQTDSPRALQPKPISEALHRPSSYRKFARMTVVPGGTYEITTHFRVRECGELSYANLNHEEYPALHGDSAQKRTLETGGFAVANAEVTNREYREFLDATGYRPKLADCFLRHWHDGKPKSGEEELPVVYIDLDDARAYASWRDMRLPTEVEWQIAMERTEHDRGPNPVWNWTGDEYSDGRTRYSIIKGGSWFEAKGSVWYADGGLKAPNFAAKFIGIWPGLDRCETIGFRCAVSL